MGKIWNMEWDEGIKKGIQRTHAKMEVKRFAILCCLQKGHRRLGCPPILSPCNVNGNSNH